MKKNQIATALKNLGVKGTVNITRTAFDFLYEIKLNGNEFGIFDTDRNTFVD
ncbi:MAG: hypothetical protein ACRC3H_16835 [Lachnospiraceae bacterium]